MGRYAILKKEFSFLEVEYGFEVNMRQEHGGYCFITWTNGKRNILVLYDDQTDVRKESPGYTMRIASGRLMMMWTCTGRN